MDFPAVSCRKIMIGSRLRLCECCFYKRKVGIGGWGKKTSCWWRRPRTNIDDDMKYKDHVYRTNQLMDHLEEAEEHPDEWDWWGRSSKEWIDWMLLYDYLLLLIPMWTVLHAICENVLNYHSPKLSFSILSSTPSSKFLSTSNPGTTQRWETNCKKHCTWVTGTMTCDRYTHYKCNYDTYYILYIIYTW